MRKQSKKRKAISARVANSSYEQIFDGVWETGNRTDLALACCDCGLVHNIRFRVKEDARGRRTVQYRMTRENRSTAQIRRWNRIKIQRPKSATQPES